MSGPNFPPLGVAWGMDVVVSDAVPVGTVLVLNKRVLIGGPSWEVRAAGREAQRIVREGLADVLVWLGDRAPEEEDVLSNLLRRAAARRG